jgi:hypothetical protein
MAFFVHTLSLERVTVDGFWIVTQLVTVLRRLVFSVTLLGSGFQRRTFLWFRAACLFVWGALSDDRTGM